MAYACPVCHEPQADGEHLANHLAFSALLGHDDHAEWLDEHAPDWNDDGPAELAARVTPHAETVDIPEFSEEIADHTPPDISDEMLNAGTVAQPTEPANLTPETLRVLEEARALTERRQAGDPEADTGSSEDGQAGRKAGEAGRKDGEMEHEDENGK